MSKTIHVKKRNGKLETFDPNKINICIQRACDGLVDVSPSEIALDAQVQLFNKIPTKDIDRALILCARSKIEKEPNYSKVAARLLLNTIYKEVFGEGVDSDAFEMQYRKSFITNLKELKKDGQIDPRLLEFDVKKLSGALDIERDDLWEYLGIQTIYDRYLLNINKRRMESPQAFWMRVAMGLAIEEEDKEGRAIEFYNLMSQFYLVPSTPTLFNSGTTRSQLSSCYLSSIGDDLDGIFMGLAGQARLSKYAGGLGCDFTPVRSHGAHIKGTNGKSSGVIPFLKCFDSLVSAVNQANLRRGSGCAYLEVWHGDFEQFLDLRRNTGDERLRTHNLNTAAWVPDLFLQRVLEDKEWSLFSPSDVPDLHEIYGEEFATRYEEYENNPKIPRKTVSAKGLWKQMLISLSSTGHPWITFKDPSNIRYSNKHCGTVMSSNLCCCAGDQLVPTKKGLFTVKELYDKGEELELIGSGGNWVKASKMHRPLQNTKIVEILTREGYTHKVTPDHKVWLYEKQEYCEAQNLKWGDKIALHPTKDDPCLLGALWLVDRKNIIIYCADYANRDDGHERAKRLQIELLIQGVETERTYTELASPDMNVWYLKPIKNKGYATFSMLDECEDGDVYCPVVESEDHLWVCNGFLTKNTEILLHSKPSKYESGKLTELGSTSVCNLSSINIIRHIELGKINFERLQNTIKTAIRMLDNVISLNFYPTDEARTTNLANRPVGLGIMGWQDALYELGINYDSEEAVDFADELYEQISYWAIEGSLNLVKEGRPQYETFKGSLWDQGILPIDSYRMLMEYRNSRNTPKINYDTTTTLDWDSLREEIKKHGLRNSNTMAIAPTATISYIAGCSQSIEPDFGVLFVYSTMSGEFTLINKYFVKKMKELGLWCDELITTIKAVDGDISLTNLPEEIKRQFKTAFKVDQNYLIKCAAARQKYIDMGQSLNLYSDTDSLKALHEMYIYAWKSGLKCTYYLRSKGASKIEKITVKDRETCSIEAMRNGEVCEACQ